MNLFELASTYSKFGLHRTGSDSQLATEDWLVDLLESRADRVECFCFDYQHFDATTELYLDGRLLTSMPLYYEAIDELRDCKNVETAIVEISADEYDVYENIQSLLKQAGRNKCDALVVATRCANDSLCAFNVDPVLKNSLPVVLVPGSEFENLSRQEINLCYSASIEQRTANNIIARFGDASKQPPVVITTPISGWFECAGERGTGFALAIALAERLSKSRAIDLVLASGHELGYLGGFEYTATLTHPPAAIIHLGSCLATFDSKLQAWSNVETAVFADLDKILRSLDIPINKVEIPSQRSDWVGEAECWAHFNCPMLSIAGDNSVFHTPEDRIDLVTDETELSKMFEVLMRLTEVISTTV